MGLDMRPMGKPKIGFEERFVDIFNIIKNNDVPKPSFIERFRGVKFPTREQLLEEWFAIQIPSYETIKAPRVGKDKKADDWIKEKYSHVDTELSLETFLAEYEGYYVIELAEEKDGIPLYRSTGQDENVFRGEFLRDCEGLIDNKLIEEAWVSKLAPDTLKYGEQLMKIADEIAHKFGLEFIKGLKGLPEMDENKIDHKLHILYSLAKWLIFYGENGHGYEADF